MEWVRVRLAAREFGMVCANYTDPRLSAIYDALNPPGPDSAFYINLGQAGSRANWRREVTM